MHALWLPLIALVSYFPLEPREDPVADFALRDARGSEWRLSDQRERRLIVVAFLGVDCPLARLYGPRLGELAAAYGPRGVAFVGVNSNSQDALSDVARYARTHKLPFPVLKDVGNVVADRLGAKRTPEVFVLDERRGVRYRGRVDDQYAVGVKRPHPSRRDLAAALDELLAGKAVSVPVTEAAGCYIGRVSAPRGDAAVTYSRDIAPILQRHCQACHRPGQVAPFSLLTYEDASGWGETIQQVVSEGRMPPWGADPRHGRFRNDPSLSKAEKKLLDAWVAAGCPEGDRADLPPPEDFPDGWELGKPDVVVEMPEPYTVPAEGVVEYQYFEVDPGFRGPTWVRGAEIRPGNRSVVHHVTVFLKPPGAPDVTTQGKLGSYCLAATAPGTPPALYPPGMAKVIPPGWHLVFVVHYQTVGTAQTDRTRLGLLLADPKAVRQEVATHLLYDEGLVIPPRAADHVVTRTWEAKEDVLLLGMFPHMHLRGRSFRYELVHPNGREEILLDVPRYDFNWQLRYDLAEPRRIAAGSVIRCTAHYDNSGANPANPDPGATVRAGTQSWDEMFNGYLDFVAADQDLTKQSGGDVLERAARRLAEPRVLLPVLALGTLVLLALRFVRARVRSAGASSPASPATRREA